MLKIQVIIGTTRQNRFSEKVAHWIYEETKKKEGIELDDDKTAMQRIREASERAKIELSSTMETDINLPFISGNKNLQLKLTRAKLEELVKDLIEKCRKPLLQALKDAKLGSSDINKIILVGGPTRMPIVKEFVERS